jgi:hypothetical protein
VVTSRRLNTLISCPFLGSMKDRAAGQAAG